MAELEKVISELQAEIDSAVYMGHSYKDCIPVSLLHNALSLLKAQEKKWIPFVKRPLTEEEKRNHPDWCFILDGEVPDDEQEILLYRPWKNKAQQSGRLADGDQGMDGGIG